MDKSTTLPTLIPFKSKKPLSTTTTTTTTPVKNTPAGPNVATPNKLHDPPSRTRTRNRNVALSLSDIRRAASQLRKPSPSLSRPDPGPVLVGNINGSDKKKKKIKSPTLLPLKYEMLCEFFNAMVSSVRLLRLKGLPATLTKLSRHIESLTDRRFTLHHLAQLKHIVPDVIAAKKIRVQDEVTGCVMEDLLVSLEVIAVETDKVPEQSSGYSGLKGVFHSRIVKYAASHPESDDVPEGELPELFYKTKEPEPSVIKTSIMQPTSLMAPSFKSRFSARALRTPASEPSSVKPLPETPIKEAASTPSKFEKTPAKLNSTPAKFASTPVEVALTPAKLMAATPALRAPKRSLMMDDAASDSPNKSAKRSRSLRFEENSDDIQEQRDEIDVRVPNSAASKDLKDVLPENLLHSLMEKEQRTLEEQDPIMSLARKRQQLIAAVPKLFDMIRLLFQSIRRSVMTKEELIHKVITGHMDIVDRGEVEEQLKLLQELAPEFITEQSCLSGDKLLRLNKSTCADSIRAKLLEAK